MGSKNDVLLSSFFVHARTFPILPPNATVVPVFLTVEIPTMAIQILKTTIVTGHFNVIISLMVIRILKTPYVSHLHYVKI